MADSRIIGGRGDCGLESLLGGRNLDKAADRLTSLVHSMEDSFPASILGCFYDALDPKICRGYDWDNFESFYSAIQRLEQTLGVHSYSELDTFGELFKRDVSENYAYNPWTHINYILQALKDSGKFRDLCRPFQEENFFIKENMQFRSRVDMVASEYLMISALIGEDGSGAGMQDDFAGFVKGLVACGYGNAAIIESMHLYNRTVVMGEYVGSVSQAGLGRAILDVSMRRSAEQEIKRMYLDVVDAGTMSCPEQLRMYIKAMLGKDVEELWDFTKYQSALYHGGLAATAFNRLTEGNIDMRLINDIVGNLKRNGMLDGSFVLMALGCGPARKEIALYEALLAEGYDVSLELHDKSRRMLEIAATNCVVRRIRNFRACETDFEKVSPEMFPRERQALVTTFGGTFFNLINKYSVAGKFQRVFEMRAGSKQRVRRAGKMDDILLIEGDTCKDISFYESHFSKLFLARGLESGYSLDMEHLMEDGKLLHTTYRNLKNGALECIYIIAKDKKGTPFRKYQAIRVIESGNMDVTDFTRNMMFADFDVSYVPGSGSRMVALCRNARDEMGILERIALLREKDGREPVEPEIVERIMKEYLNDEYGSVGK